MIDRARFTVCCLVGSAFAILAGAAGHIMGAW
jgi:hypothetical protein